MPVKNLFAVVNMYGDDSTGTIDNFNYVDLKPFQHINAAIKAAVKLNCQGLIPVYININPGHYDEKVKLKDHIHLKGSKGTSVKQICAKGSLRASISYLSIIVKDRKYKALKFEQGAKVIRKNIDVIYQDNNNDNNILQRSRSLSIVGSHFKNFIGI